MSNRDLPRKTAKHVTKKKAQAPEVPSSQEIRDLESMEIPEKAKKEVCQEVAEHMGISVEEFRRLMEKLDSGILSRKRKK